MRAFRFSSKTQRLQMLVKDSPKNPLRGMLGQVATVAYDAQRLVPVDLGNPGANDLPIEFNLFHSETRAFATRVVAPFVLKPGKNEIRLAIKDLKNTNGSPAKLAEVRRGYVASETRATLLVGDIYLEGKQ